MELHDGFGTVSTLHCDLFSPPVVFNILLQYKRHTTPLKSPNDEEGRKKTNKKKPHHHNPQLCIYLQVTSEKPRGAPDRSSSQTWGAHPGSSAFSADGHLDSQTSCPEVVHFCCLQSVGGHCCSY